MDKLRNESLSKWNKTVLLSLRKFPCRRVTASRKRQEARQCSLARDRTSDSLKTSNFPKVSAAIGLIYLRFVFKLRLDLSSAALSSPISNWLTQAFAHTNSTRVFTAGIPGGRLRISAARALVSSGWIPNESVDSVILRPKTSFGCQPPVREVGKSQLEILKLPIKTENSFNI